MAREPRGRRTWRIVRWAAVVLAVDAAGVVLLLKSAPAPYRRTEPMGVDREALRQFNTRVVNQVGNVLLDENIGGTIHVALGDSKPRWTGKNRSRLHWDLVCDLRRGGRLYADDKLVMKNGKWLVG